VRPDPFQLERFVEAQAETFDEALSELRDGAKRSHWMWFVFPQIAGLGQSAMSRRYAIRSLAEAKAYLEHPLLGARLRQCVAAILAWAGKRDAVAILGSIDAMKLHSSLTLFAAAAPDEERFAQALAAFFGSSDSATIGLLA
jgi:uncharacterized protein (DUF1810 family)